MMAHSATPASSENKPNRLTSNGYSRLVKVFLLVPIILFAIGNYLLLSRMLSGHHFFLRTVGPVYHYNTLLVPGFFFASGFLSFMVAWKRIGTRKVVNISIGYILLAVSILSVRYYATHVEPYCLQVRTVEFPTAKINRPLNLLHISDIQSDSVGDYERKVFEKIRELNPDLILHTGDLLQPASAATWDNEFSKIAALFETLSPPLGMWTVIGNTDAYSPEQEANGVGNMKVLNSQNMTIPFEKTRIQILGLGVEESRAVNKNRVISWLEETSPDDFTILMGHKPPFLLTINDLPIDLCLAGHTHGGQIRIPGYGPLTVLCPIPLEWGRGFHQVGNTHFNVSAGIGCEHFAGIPPLRLFCPPEMTMIRLVPSQDRL